jgi:hypothetical protein
MSLNNPAVYTLAALQITTARSLSLLTPTTGLAGMTSVGLECNFQWGSGGSTCSLLCATTFDGGTTWRHIARFDFTTAVVVKYVNLQVATSKAVTAYSDLAAEGVNDQLLGDQLAAYIVSTGTYVNTTASLRASVR